MNKENIKKVIDHLRDEQMQMINDSSDLYIGSGSMFEFSMDNFSFPCGTPSCIAGHAAHNAGVNIKDMSPGLIFDHAVAFFDVESFVADNLFCPISVDYNKITPDIAADMLENFIKTEEVVWPEEVKYSND